MTSKALLYETKQRNRSKRVVAATKLPRTISDHSKSHMSQLVPIDLRRKIAKGLIHLSEAVNIVSERHARTNLGWFGDSKGPKLMSAPRDVLLVDPTVQAIRQSLRDFFPPDYIFPFRMTACGISVQSSAGGATLQNISFDPNTTTYNEWSTISLLFDEVKVVQAELNLTSTLLAASVLTINPWFGAPIYSVISTAPPNVDSIYRLTNVKVFTPLCTSGKPAVVLRAHCPTREFAAIGTPSEISPPSGCVGAFWVCAANANTASQTYFLGQLDTLCQFRIRA